MSAILQKSPIVAMIAIAITIAIIEYFNILLSSDLLQTNSQRKIFKSLCCNITQLSTLEEQIFFWLVTIYKLIPTQRKIIQYHSVVFQKVW